MPPRRAKLLVCLLLFTATLAAYWQVKDHEFINYDDPGYVTENPMVNSGFSLEGVVWAFSATHADNWHPVTWLSHMLDCQLFGLHPGGHHLTNVLLHAVNTLILFLLLAKLTAALWPSALVAALFAIHPLHVESVAWVAERKDVLSTFFFLITIWAYARYAAAPGLGGYLLVFFFFALGLMAKSMLVTLPFVLLLLDYWPLGRLHPPPPARKRRKAPQAPAHPIMKPALRLIWEKVPLLALTGVSCFLTLVAQKKVLMPMVLTPLDRTANALVAYVSYLGKMLWPIHLAVFYPHPGNSLPVWQVAAAGLLLAGVTFTVFKKARKYPYLPVGWCWYLGTLTPVIGLVQVGGQAMADRYTYIPLIGIFIMLAWGAADLAAAWRLRRLTPALAAGVLMAIFATLTWMQTSHWRNSFLLFEHAAQVTENNYMAYCNLGDAYAEQGKGDEAIRMFHKAIELSPNFAETYSNLGIEYGRQSRMDEAVAAFQKAIELKPDYSEAYCNLGIAYAHQGRNSEATAMFQQALRIDPGNEGAQKMLNLITRQ